MPLLPLWASNPTVVLKFNIEQVVATAGDGKLLDDNVTSQELRQFLSEVTTDKLADYTNHCLSTPFNKSGIVLQDLVNELGRRLDYSVENGLYQGKVNAIGYDGIWHSSEGKDIVVEVKTTDTYRISLDTFATYRNKLSESAKVQKAASILLVVGREDTGELESQVRGSRHAWDMRLISIDALLKLVRVKESTETGVTGAKIRSILAPMEYTRLDALVDVMFTATKDVEATVEIEKLPVPDEADGTDIDSMSGDDGKTSVTITTDPAVLQAKRDEIISMLGQRDKKKLVKRSRALFWDTAHTYRAICTVSKRYPRKGYEYWYAYHPAWDAFLAEGEVGNLSLGCADLDVAFILPYSFIHSHLDDLNVTIKADGSKYWHLHIFEIAPNSYALRLHKTGSHAPLTDFTLTLP